MAIITGTGGERDAQRHLGQRPDFRPRRRRHPERPWRQRQLDGGTGADTMNGGTGNDTYFVDDVGDVVNENSGEGTDTVRVTGLAAYALTANVEKLRQHRLGHVHRHRQRLNNYIYRRRRQRHALRRRRLRHADRHRRRRLPLRRRGRRRCSTAAPAPTTMEGGTGNDVYYRRQCRRRRHRGVGRGHRRSLHERSPPTRSAATSRTSTTMAAPALHRHRQRPRQRHLRRRRQRHARAASTATTRCAARPATTLSTGGDGDDLIVGGSGADDMTGGNDDDTFRIATFESGTGASADRILDFVQGDDIVDLAGMDADLLTRRQPGLLVHRRRRFLAAPAASCATSSTAPTPGSRATSTPMGPPISRSSSPARSRSWRRISSSSGGRGTVPGLSPLSGHWSH